MAALQLVVLSNDDSLRRDVEAALAGSPAVQTVWRAWDAGVADLPSRGERIVLIDDEGCADALAVVQGLHAREREAQIIYLAARHSVDLEREVRRIGVSYYADKAARGRNAVLAIEAMLRAKGTWVEPEQREPGVVQAGLAAREEKRGCAS